MHFPTVATCFRLLSKCFTKSSVSSSSVSDVVIIASTTSVVGAVMEGVEGVEQAAWPIDDVSKRVEMKGGTGEQNIADIIENTRPVGTSVMAFEVSKPRIDSSKVQVEAHVKDLEFVSVKHSTLRFAAQNFESGDVDELMNIVLKAFHGLYETKEFRPRLRMPVFDENVSGTTEVENPPPTWIDAVKEAEIALEIARCEMTFEDVDDLLTRLYVEMNHLVVGHAKGKEERKRMALEVSTKIQEYAGVLLESRCEIRLAVERARVRSVVAKRFTPSDAWYLASLTPGSSHIPSCDGSCVSSYLPRRVVERSEVVSFPELTSEGSECSTPSEIPSTPHASIAELLEGPNITVISDGAKSEEILPVKSKEVADPKMVSKKIPAHKPTKVAGGKPVWKF